MTYNKSLMSIEEVMTRSKGFDLIDGVPENYGWRLITLYRRQSPKASP